MPVKCAVCRHEKRDEIEAAMVAGLSLREIGERFGVGKNVVERHRKKGHLAQSLANTPAAREAARGDVLLAQLGAQQAKAADLYQAAQKVLKRAERKRDPATALAAIRGATVALAEMRNSLELFGRLAGTMPRLAGSSTTVNVAVAVAGTEPGGHLVAKLSALIAGTRERQLPAGAEPAPAAGEVEGEVITVERAR